VKRYDHSEKDDCRGMVSNDEDGDWVRWEDAAALEKRLAEATALLKTVPLPDPDDEGPTLGDIDTAFYVIATLKRRLSATPSPPAEPALTGNMARVAALAADFDGILDGVYDEPAHVFCASCGSPPQRVAVGDHNQGCKRREHAPGLVEQIEVIVNDYTVGAGLRVNAPQCMHEIRDLLRAAREAGWR
jgi:hypothetical protein